MTDDGLNTYVYNAINQLASATLANNDNVKLFYDGADRLYQINLGLSVRRLLYDGANLIGEYAGSSNVLQRRYIHGPGTDNPIMCVDGGTGAGQQCLPGIDGTDGLTMLADERGSVLAYANDNAEVVQKNSFDAFGHQKGWNEGTFRYTGQTWLPELGLYHYKARLYNPELGRFLQTDPIGYEDQMNMYAYVGNDPMNLVDPSGLCTAANSGSSFTCGLQNFFQKNISLPVTNFLFNRADDIRESRGLSPVKRVDEGGAARSSLVAEQSSINGELSAIGFAVVKAGLDSRNPVKAANKIHGNDRRSQKRTELYHLVDRNDGSIQKIGITSSNYRYSARYLRRNNVRQVTQFTFNSRYPALVAENISLVHFRVNNGRLPKLNKTTR